MRLIAILATAALLLALAPTARAVPNEHDQLCRLLLRDDAVYGFGIDATPTWAGEHWRSESPIIRVRVYYNAAGDSLRWTSSRAVLAVLLASDEAIEGPMVGQMTGAFYARSYEASLPVPEGPQTLGLWCYQP
jgi:hypothetical protein